MKYKKTTLQSGLRIITVPTKGNPAATVMVLVEAGSNYESKDHNGLSHFLEHMVFKGTAKRPTALDISKELDSLGAENNAFTMTEMTGYHSKSDKRHWKKLLEIISDMYLNPTFPGDDLEKEKGVILQEISMYEDIPQRKVWYTLIELLYGDAPAGRPVIGLAENIKKFTREDFINYRNTHYTAEKTIVIVAGDVSHSTVEKEAKKHFKTIKRGKGVGKPKVKETQTAPALKVFKKKTDQAHMIMAFRGYEAKDKKVPDLSILAAVLGGGMSSRLYYKLREEMGACYYINVYHEEYTDHGLLTISTGVSAVRAEEVTKVILEECKRLATVPLTEGELKKAKEFYLGHLYMGLETSDALAGFYGDQEVSKHKLETPKDIEKRIRAVKAKDVQRLAQDIFRNEKLNLAIVGDIKEQSALKKALKF
jgi:predicted Zn-dependent peptidase